MTGLFTTMRVRGGYATFWERHLVRLREGAARFALPLPSVAVLRGEIAVAVGGLEDARVRVLLETGGHRVTAQAYEPPTRPWRVRVQTVVPDEETVRFKTLSRDVYKVARQAASDVDEALLIDGDGQCLEFTTANVFLVTGTGTLCTPPATAPLLPGVARAALLHGATEAGFVVEVRPLTIEDASSAAAVIATNALFGVHAVGEISGLGRFADSTWAARLGDTLPRREAEERIIG